MRVSEAEELALYYRNNLTNLDDNHIYMYAPAYDSYKGVFIRVSIRRDTIPVSFELFGFDSYNKAYHKPRDWYDLK